MGSIPLVEPPATPIPPKGWTPFALGFRPFFVLAGLSGALLMILWMVFRHMNLTASAYFGSSEWHSHEMLFGFTVAIIAGFLLTAVRNWTGMDTPTGRPLALLALLWLAGRLLPLIPAIPDWLIAIVDLSFIPALIFALYSPLMKGVNHVNRLFLPLLGGMALANLLYHLQGLGFTSTGRQGIELMLNLILLLLIVVGGRVLPFFTEKAVSGAEPRFSKRREQWVYITIILWILSELLLSEAWLMFVASLSVAITQFWRFIDWHHPGVWQRPILWVLFTGLGWLIIGFLLKALAVMGAFPHNLSTHALTAGAIGVFAMGMMARVSLGHTGRELQVSRMMTFGFVLINLAVAVRVFLPLTEILTYQACVWLSGSLWVVCYLAFCLSYFPILIRPRPDGRPG
ncbi:MAG: NnrS family protein [Candidatus Thiodiazotropha sp. (ex Epidulcina cf. delphinae)]|nr:NnrS family protein [Candidatus Thiodiazotropha sp. (ex Epidulcina cf. delphinae)]MCU7907194.1 NnrS family protein [Candidatus Thiodiazotropha sp. (ex Epidulcina cf. delphinae)]